MSRLSISELREGMVLERPVYTSDNQNILLAYGTVLKDSMIRKLNASGIKEVYIADRYTLFITPIQQMANYLKESYHNLIAMYSADKPEGNLSDSMVYIAQMVRKVVDKICEDERLLDFCVQMKILKDCKLFEYSVQTSVFSGLLAGAMGLNQDMYNIMVGALLHHIGCLEMPFLIGAKKMNAQEELLWKEHPMYGYYFSIQHNFPREIAEIIQYHHENWDGTGYPKKLKGEEIPLGARIVSICCSVSSNLFFNNLQPYEAMEYIYCSSNILYDKEIVDAFVNNITLYPLGALVRLTTGEVGIISNVRKNHGPRPIVNVFYNRFNKPLTEPKIVDLGKERTVFISEVLG